MAPRPYNERRRGRAGDAAVTATIDPELLAILVCPLTRTPLRLEDSELISDAAGLAFPIRSGVPIMIPELARPLGDAHDRRTP